MERIDKDNIQAVNGRDETDDAIALIIDKINEIIDWINSQ